MGVKKDSGSAFFWVVIVLIIFWRAVRAARGEFSQKERLGGFKPTCYTQAFAKVAKQEKDMSPSQVRKNLHHQIWYSVTNQEEKEIERRKNFKLTPERQEENMKKYFAWKVKYMSDFLKKK